MDVDLRFAEALGDLGGPRILSSHDVAPDAAALDARAREGDGLRADPGDLVKLVPAARTGSDALTVLTWLDRRPRGGTVAFTTGAVGSFSRCSRRPTALRRLRGRARERGKHGEYGRSRRPPDNSRWSTCAGFGRRVGPAPTWARGRVREPDRSACRR